MKNLWIFVSVSVCKYHYYLRFVFHLFCTIYFHTQGSREAGKPGKAENLL